MKNAVITLISSDSISSSILSDSSSICNEIKYSA